MAQHNRAALDAMNKTSDENSNEEANQKETNNDSKEGENEAAVDEKQVGDGQQQ